MSDVFGWFFKVISNALGLLQTQVLACLQVLDFFFYCICHEESSKDEIAFMA